MRNQKGVSLIALIITIIVMIILAAIVMSSGGNTISQANYASFAQQFGEYADQVKVDAATVMAETGKNGKTINTAQQNIMVALGRTDLSGDDGVSKWQLPVGYVIPDPIKEALGLTSDTTNTVVAYLIQDNQINGYEKETNLDFYGDSNGIEHHLITSDGRVFTIPGFQEEQENGSVKYYINSQGAFYMVKGKSAEDIELTVPVQAKDFDTLHGVDYEGVPNDDGTAGEGASDDAPETILYAAGLVLAETEEDGE